jgi:gluconokinase
MEYRIGSTGRAERLVHPPWHQLAVHQHDPPAARTVLGVLDAVVADEVLADPLRYQSRHAHKPRSPSDSLDEVSAHVPARLDPPIHVVTMGVTATGKSSVAQRLAKALDVEFLEGDDLHPQSNIDKMAAGIPLGDADRRPWLQAIADLIGERHRAGTSVVVTCSALRRSYRDLLRSGLPDSDIFFLHLHGDFDLLFERMAQRTKHFMPPTLLQSQFDTLEPLGDDERGVLVDVAPPLDAVVAEAVGAVRAAYAG